MELRIKSMTIQNFKRIKNFSLDFDGNDYNIYGDNETGKTTIFDAFVWCLFGKDSLGQTNFEIKPLQKNGTPIHNLETVVEILFERDGKNLLLKRLYREIWRGKRGSKAELFGHESLTYINEEKVGVKEYEKYINDLIDEDIFKILTNVNYFNQLKPAKQREQLFMLVSDINDADIINSNNEFEPLKDLLIDGRTVESLIKILKDKIKQTQSQLDDYPIRIGVLKDINYQISDNYNDDLNSEKLTAAYKRQSELEKAKATKSSDKKIDELENAIRGFDNEIEKLKGEMENAKREAEYEKQGMHLSTSAELNKLKNELQKKEIELNNYQHRLKNGKKVIEEEKADRNQIYEDYKTEQSKMFIPEKCSYCGQDLPKEMVDEFEKKFNLEKAERLAKLQEKGEAISNNIDKFIKATVNFENQITLIENEITKVKSDIDEKEQMLEKIKAQPITVDNSKILEKIEKATERKNVVIKELEKTKKGIQPSLFDEDLTKTQKEIETLLANRTEYRIKIENESKIKMLEKEEKDTRKRYEEHIKKIELCERFIVEKRNAYETKIDNNFELVKFKLYEELLNGGVKEICVATVDGVPYSSLNNAARINAGLDIIRALQKIYNVKVPIFIDNAESTTNYIPLENQLIKLYVSENDKELRFMVAGETGPIIQPEIKIEKREEI